MIVSVRVAEPDGRKKQEELYADQAVKEHVAMAQHNEQYGNAHQRAAVSNNIVESDHLSNFDFRNSGFRYFNIPDRIPAGSGRISLYAKS